MGTGLRWATGAALFRSKEAFMYWDQETLYAVIFILTAWSAGNIMFR